jgi:hypothetical protein
LNHPNIGSIYHLQESDGSRYLVLELVEGDTLPAFVKLGRPAVSFRPLATGWRNASSHSSDRRNIS